MDRAEAEPEKAMLVNGKGPGILAETARQTDAVLIHFSTDYVFSGNKKGLYKEGDRPDPVSVYGKTKLAGEQKIIASGAKFFIFRISWLYGKYGKNFVTTILKLLEEKGSLNVVDDQRGSPTYASLLAENITRNISMFIRSDSSKYGIYHYSDIGYISWYRFASEIQELAWRYNIIKSKIPINPVSSKEFPRPAPRPANSNFDLDKVRRQLGFVIRDWKWNLSHFLGIKAGVGREDPLIPPEGEIHF